MGNATLATVDRALLLERLAERGEPAYRAHQVWSWAAQGAPGYAAMMNVPAERRGELESAVPFSPLEVVRSADSHDRTVNLLFLNGDGTPVEAVLMRFRHEP